MQPTMESTTADRPGQRQHRQRENKIRGMRETENITEQEKNGEKKGGRKTERDKERQRVNGSGPSQAETVELADCEKPESPCRLFRVFLSAIMAH